MIETAIEQEFELSTINNSIKFEEENIENFKKPFDKMKHRLNKMVCEQKKNQSLLKHLSYGCFNSLRNLKI